MASGPCGVDFREAFGCFHYSKADPKGSDCYDAFVTMQECMSNHPEVYPAAEKQLGESLDQLDGETSKDDNKLSEISSVSEVKSWLWVVMTKLTINYNQIKYFSEKYLLYKCMMKLYKIDFRKCF